MLSQEKIGIENKAIQPSEEDFEFRSGELDGYRVDSILSDLRTMRDGVASAVQTLRDDLEILTEHQAALDASIALAESTHAKIQSGTFATPKPSPALPQNEIEERHRAPF
jgi:hypothetical protein